MVFAVQCPNPKCRKYMLVEEYDRNIKTVSMLIKIPAVVRLLGAFRRHKKPVKFSRSPIPR